MKKASTIKVFQDCLGIGIDVSKAELAVVGMTLDEPYLKCIRNEMQAIKAFIRIARRDSGVAISCIMRIR